MMMLPCPTMLTSLHRRRMCDVATRRETARRNAFVMHQICDGRARACPSHAGPAMAAPARAHSAPAPRWARPVMPIARRVRDGAVRATLSSPHTRRMSFLSQSGSRTQLRRNHR